MNVLSKGASSMRIIALPLARVKMSREAKQEPHSGVNLNTMPVFYHFDLISESPYGGREDPSWNTKVTKTVINKATDIWTNLGKAAKGSWKLWVYELGERITHQIEFEELALRNIDPSIGPSVSPTGINKQDHNPEKDTNRSHSVLKIPLIHPPSPYSMGGADHASHSPVAHLQALLASCGPRHRRGFYLWMLIAPLTTPITLIPIIPNLPFFFCIWRSWSHYRAYRSSQYLSSLLHNGLIEPDPSLSLDKLYASSALSSKMPQSPRPLDGKPAFKNLAADNELGVGSEKDTSPSVCMLLPREAIPGVLEMFHLPESAAVNVYRAMDQARGRLERSSEST